MEYQLAADFDLWSRFYMQTELFGLNSPLSGFRVHKNQRSRHQIEVYREEARHSLNVARTALKWEEKLRPMKQYYEQDNPYFRMAKKGVRRLTANKNAGKNINRVVQEQSNIWKVEEVSFYE